jgi:hypothetical protein
MLYILFSFNFYYTKQSGHKKILKKRQRPSKKRKNRHSARKKGKKKASFLFKEINKMAKIIHYLCFLRQFEAKGQFEAQNRAKNRALRNTTIYSEKFSVFFALWVKIFSFLAR